MTTHPFNDSEHHVQLESLVPITIRSREDLDEFFTKKEFYKQRNDVLANIASRLKQFRLINAYDPSEILSEAYLRAAKYISINSEIESTVPWLKSVGFNIVREKGRKNSKQKNLAKKTKAQASSRSTPCIPESSIEANVLSAFQSFQNLTLEEQQILHYWLIKGLPWKRVCMSLAEEGLLDRAACLEDKTIARIRRKGGRILKKLRKGYF